MRGIVDLALAYDPRIKRIKEEEKAAREAKKKNKGGVNGTVNAKQKAEEDKRKAEEEAKRKEEEEKVRSSRRATVAHWLTATLLDRSCGGEKGQGSCCERREKGQASGARCRRRWCPSVAAYGCMIRRR